MVDTEVRDAGKKNDLRKEGKREMVDRKQETTPEPKVTSHKVAISSSQKKVLENPSMLCLNIHVR